MFWYLHDEECIFWFGETVYDFKEDGCRKADGNLEDLVFYDEDLDTMLSFLYPDSVN